MNEFAVSPCSSSLVRVVMTVTPVRKLPSASRNRSGAGAGHSSASRIRFFRCARRAAIRGRRTRVRTDSGSVGVLIIAETNMTLQIVS